jgi:crotonobetainyl-CoA:carnitine CoA-transferase CaiB-like acyl-CoA transferase
MLRFMRRGARRLALDLKSERGSEVMTHLLQQADVLVESFRPGVVARLGLDYATLHPAFPRLIYCSISGYGQEGPYRNRAGHDLNYLALGGLLGMTGSAGGPPAIPGTLIADLAGGQSAALAVMAALLARERSGKGQYIDLSLQESVAGLMAPTLGFPPEETAGAAATMLTGAAPWYNVYETADGRYLAVAALEPHFYRRLCEQVGRPEWSEAQFGRAGWPARREEMAAIIRGKTLDGWLALFAETDACVTPVLTLQEVLADPQLATRGTFMRVAQPDGSETVYVRALPPLEGTAELLCRGSHGEGEGTEELLRELKDGSDA